MRSSTAFYSIGSWSKKVRARLTLESLDLRDAPSSCLDVLLDDAVLLLASSGDPHSQTAAICTAPAELPPAASDAALVLSLAACVSTDRFDAATAPTASTAAGAVVSWTTSAELINEPDPENNLSPRIINFVGVEVAQGLFVFSGDVVDEAPGGLTIYFGGEPVSLQGVTVTTDASGHFEKAIFVNTDGSDNGIATAHTFDSQGLQSNVATCFIQPG
jgi:hypothetical protein